MVAVGNAGNPADMRDTLTGFGSFGYSYKLGKYVVQGIHRVPQCRSQGDDPHGLYNLATGDPAGPLVTISAKRRGCRRG